MSEDGDQEELNGVTIPVLGVEALMFFVCVCMFCSYEIVRLLVCVALVGKRKVKKKLGKEEEEEEKEDEQLSYGDQELRDTGEISDSSQVRDSGEEVIRIEDSEDLNESAFTMEEEDFLRLSGEESEEVSIARVEVNERRIEEEEIEEEENRRKNYLKQKNRGFGMSTCLGLEYHPKTSTFVSLAFRAFSFFFNLSWLIYIFIVYQKDTGLLFLVSTYDLGILTLTLLTLYYYVSMNYCVILLVVQISSLWNYEPRKPFFCMKALEYCLRLMFILCFVSCLFVTFAYWFVVAPVQISRESFRIKPETIPLHGLNSIFTIVELIGLFRVTFPPFLCFFSGIFPWVYLIMTTIFVKTKVIESYPYNDLIDGNTTSSIFLRILIGLSFCVFHFLLSVILYFRSIGFFCCEKCQGILEQRKEEDMSSRNQMMTTLDYLNKDGKRRRKVHKKSKKKKKDLGVPNGYKLMIRDDSGNGLLSNTRKYTSVEQLTQDPVHHHGGDRKSSVAGLISVNFERLNQIRSFQDEDEEEEGEGESRNSDESLDEEEEEEEEHDEEHERILFVEEDEEDNNRDMSSSGADQGDEEFETPDSS